MSNTRGFRGLQPCPICHVPKDELHDCGKARWPLRTGIGTEKIFKDARKLGPAKGEELLKENGLRLIDVCSETSDSESSLFNCA
jgi:hypothetical protein